MCLFSVFALYWNLVNNRVDFKSNLEYWAYYYNFCPNWDEKFSARPTSSVHRAHCKVAFRVRDFVDYRQLVKQFDFLLTMLWDFLIVT